MCTTQAVDVDGEGLETPEDTTAGTYRFCLYVTLDGVRNNTRAENDGVQTTSTAEMQTEAEKEIKTVTLFFNDIADDGTESAQPSYVQTFSLQYLTPLSNGSYRLSFRARLVPGKKKLYIGANLRADQIAAFNNGTDCTYNCGTLTGDEQPVQKVMDIDSNGNGSNIAMFATKGQELTIDSEFDPDKAYEPDEPFELTRLVSKVLLLFSSLDVCQTEGDDHTHIKVKLYNDEEDGTTYGWAPLSDVRYFLNATNKKIYLLPRTNKDGNDIDPNWEVGNFLTAVEGQNDLRMVNTSAFNQNFDYYEATEMLPTWRDDTQEDVYYFQEMLRAIPEEYDKAKVEAREYKSGLYCMENLVYNNTGVNDIDQSANLVTTYMVVAIRFVPRDLWDVSEEGSLTETKYEHHMEALAQLKGQTDNDGNKFYPGTYWVRQDNDGKYLFYTYKGMLLEIAQSADTDTPLTEGDFTKHSAGLSYYTTYIDREESDYNSTTAATSASTISYKGRTVWGLRRNYHYTLIVESLNGLGSSEPGTSPIKVRSVRDVKWTYQGSQTVLITPGM
jgi:hypothetical protein